MCLDGGAVFEYGSSIYLGVVFGYESSIYGKKLLEGVIILFG